MRYQCLLGRRLVKVASWLSYPVYFICLSGGQYLTKYVEKYFLACYINSGSVHFGCVYNVIEWTWPGSSVGIETELRAGRSGNEFRWGRDFPPLQTGPGAHPTSYTMDTGSFPGVKCGRSVLLITHRLLVPRSWKSRVIPLSVLWATPDL